jgi:hypothetical protein
MFLFLMDIFAWIFVIAIGATALLLAFYGLARVLDALAPAIGVIFLLAFIVAIVSQLPEPPPWVAGAVLLVAAYGFLAFVVYVRYFRRKPALPPPKADMPVNSRASTSSADQGSSSGRR